MIRKFKKKKKKKKGATTSWSKDDVKQWIYEMGTVYEPYADQLYQEGINGSDLTEDFDLIMEDVCYDFTNPRTDPRHLVQLKREWQKLAQGVKKFLWGNEQ